MFSQVCYILFTEGGCIHDAPFNAPPDVSPWMHPPGCIPDAPLDACHPRQKTDGQQAVGTHPAGMHSF